MVIYFTGTGNSKFAAENIAKITGDTVYDSALSLKEGTAMSFTEEDTLVFVCPIYVSALPEPFEALIRKSSFKKGAKAYFFMTYAGGIGAADRFCKKICEDMDLQYMGTSGVAMPQNYLLYFPMGSDWDNRKTVGHAMDAIKKAAEAIRLSSPFEETKSKISHYLIAKVSLPIYDKFFITAKDFYATDECIGCSKCARVCPLGNISMKDKVPVWGDKCTHCMGCINLCPKEAIEFGNRSQGKPRYHGPSI